jgi:hypothetical protein
MERVCKRVIGCIVTSGNKTVQKGKYQVKPWAG